MKYFSLLLIILSFVCCAQDGKQTKTISQKNLVGIWQADNNKESAAWDDVYRFFEDGKFIYNPSQYDGLKRILVITGKYRIVENSLHLKIDSTTEIVGGYLIRSTITTLSDSWEITGGEIKEFKQLDKGEQIIELQHCQNKPSEAICILMDNRSYYKMQSDATKY